MRNRVALTTFGALHTHITAGYVLHTRAENSMILPYRARKRACATTILYFSSTTCSHLHEAPLQFILHHFFRDYPLPSGDGCGYLPFSESGFGVLRGFFFYSEDPLALGCALKMKEALLYITYTYVHSARYFQQVPQF